MYSFDMALHDWLLSELLGAVVDGVSAVHREFRFSGETLYRMGLGVGHRLAARTTNASQTQSTTPLTLQEPMDAVKCLCREIWMQLFRKHADKLQSNYRGTWVITDQCFGWIVRLHPAIGPDASQQLSEIPVNVETQRFLMYPCGIIQGVLETMGLHCTVSADASRWPACSFTVQDVIKQQQKQQQQQQAAEAGIMHTRAGSTTSSHSEGSLTAYPQKYHEGDVVSTQNTSHESVMQKVDAENHLKAQKKNNDSMNAKLSTLTMQNATAPMSDQISFSNDSYMQNSPLQKSKKPTQLSYTAFVQPWIAAIASTAGATPSAEESAVLPIRTRTSTRGSANSANSV